MVASWRGGPRAAANPWRALTLEWQVSSPPPIFNFDSDPDRRRRPVRVRRARAPCTASSRAPPRCRRSGGHPRHDHGGVGGDRREDHPRRRQRDARRGASCWTGQGEARPRRAASASSSASRAPTRATATSSTTRPSSTPRRCASTSRARSCASEGIEAVGEVGDPDPYTATMDAIAEYHPDEIIISTYPATSSGWLRRDLVERIAEATGHARSSTSSSTSTSEGLPFERHARGRQPHRRRAPRCSSALKAQGAGRPPSERHVFIVVVPAGGRRRRRRAPGARAPDAGRSTALRAAGLLAPA